MTRQLLALALATGVVPAAPVPLPAAAVAPAPAASVAPARPAAAFLLTVPVHLGATLGATWLGSRAVTADGDGTYAAHLTGLRDHDAPAQAVFVGSLVLAAPALSALVPYGLVESQPGVTTPYAAIWAAGAVGQLAGLGIVAASEGPSAVVLSVLLVAAAEVGAAVLFATPE